MYQMDAIWRTLIANMPTIPSHDLLDRRNMYAQIVHHSAATSETLPDNTDAKLDCTPLLKEIRKAVSYSASSPHRKFFISKKGYFGLGPPDCANGDIICLSGVLTFMEL
jgi:hypothetical protein